MTLVLQKDENLENTYEIKGKGFGSGILYGINKALVIDGKKQGIYNN